MQAKHERLYADFMQAASLLRDPNLVWSADLDSIRRDLADYLEEKAKLGVMNNESLIYIVQNIIADENDLSIGN